VDLTEGSETSANINQNTGIHPKVDILNMLVIETWRSSKRN
jgi:hypothetical protein